MKDTASDKDRIVANLILNKVKYCCNSNTTPFSLVCVRTLFQESGQ